MPKLYYRYEILVLFLFSADCPKSVRLTFAWCTYWPQGGGMFYYMYMCKHNGWSRITIGAAVDFFIMKECFFIALKKGFFLSNRFIEVEV